MPHKGWTCLKVEDLGSAIGECQACGKERIRYLYTIEHPRFPRKLIVGCVCDENLTADYSSPRQKQRRLIRRAARRARWLTRLWRHTRSGNPYIHAQGILVAVFKFTQPPVHGLWGYWVDGTLGEQAFNTCDEAKLAAFDEFWHQLYTDDSAPNGDEDRSSPCPS